MIDKRIYYCWFGNKEMSDLNKKCIESWHRFCPDYEIVKISEENFDYNCHPYSKTGYEHENWSFVTNVARFNAVKEKSGIYLDVDIELIKPLDWVLQFEKGFITEFESGQPDSAVIGCGQDMYPQLYEDVFAGLNPGTILHKQFIQRLYEKYDIHGNPVTVYPDGFAVLGEEFFPSVRTGLITKNTIGIHYFENTWMKGWAPVTDNFHPYPRALVCFGNRVVHEDTNPEIKITLKNNFKSNWMHPDIHEKINYFFNPNVIRLSNRDFDAERLVYDRSRPYIITVTPSGLVVTKMMLDAELENLKKSSEKTETKSETETETSITKKKTTKSKSTKSKTTKTATIEA